jgi:prepilin peptidase CpaA
MISLLQTVLVVAFPALVLFAALRDVTSYTIPNWISLALVGAFPLAALACGLSLASFGLHVAVGLGALVLVIGMFAMRWIGGGDAKLFAAAALWLGWPAALTFAVWTCLAGGALTFLLLALRRPMLRQAVLSAPRWFARLAEPEEDVPYGVAIAVGALMAFPACAMADRIHLPF